MKWKLADIIIKEVVYIISTYSIAPMSLFICRTIEHFQIYNEFILYSIPYNEQEERILTIFVPL